MRIDKIDSLTFGNKSTTFKNAVKKLKDHVFTDIKPIKSYAQYMKEYGLIKNTKSV